MAWIMQLSIGGNVTAGWQFVESPSIANLKPHGYNEPFYTITTSRSHRR